mmetsp:Transcript_61827/g.138046  ORF Transcript_61827/g.138046 Transcript_61827/m.138046 type:complete len:303 (+) Transcript_61827:53-961(+)
MADDAVDGKLEQFFLRCIEAMASEATRAKLKDPSSGRPGRHLLALQTGVWQELGVSEDAGRAAVRGVPAAATASDSSLPGLKRAFAAGADAAYLRCLEDRRPRALTKGRMPRDVVLEFLEACNVKLDTQEVRERLQQKIEDTGGLPETVVNEVHEETMELLGFEPEYARTCFAEFGKNQEFAQDKDVAVAYARWRGKSSDVMLELLYNHWQKGGTLHVDAAVKHKMLLHRAKVELDEMSKEGRRKLLEASIDKVNVFHKLPEEGRQRYLDRLDDEEKLAFIKAEMLVLSLVRAQQPMLHPAE